MNMQDRRATADPFMYIITEMTERPAAEGCGDLRLIDDDGSTWDIGEAGIEYAEDIMEYAKDFHNTDIIDGQMIKNFLVFESLSREIYFTREREGLHKMRSNIFFTEDAVRLHIKQNNYHYNEGEDYIIHAWRNSEMEMVHKFLKGIVK